MISSFGKGLAALILFTVGGLFVVSVAESAPRCTYNSPYVCKAKREKACGKVMIWQEGVRAATRVFARGVPCRKARRVIHRGSHGLANGPWRSVMGSGEGSLYVKGGSSYHGPKLRWKRYVRSSNLLRRSRAGSAAGSGNVTRGLALRRLCGNNPLWVWVSKIRTKGVSCGVAYRITKRHGKAGHPCWSKGICRIQGYRCRVTGSHIGWSSHRCKRGRKVINFQNGG